MNPKRSRPYPPQHVTDKQTPDLRIGLVGAGSMGLGIAFQVRATSGMALAWACDQNVAAARKAAELGDTELFGSDFAQLFLDHPIDVLVEATNSIGAAAEYCLIAIRGRAHVVLMNAEVDLALGPLLNAEAARHQVTITSDAGDQHGVLAALIKEADLMGFEILQAGNIKGFLDQEATPNSIAEEAAKRNLSPTQCCAYTDGTKLHIEMAVLANAFGYLPPEGGMTGPRAESVQEALQLFDFSQYEGTPRIDYLLGAEPGGGVYLIVRPKFSLPPEQKFYLNYYKLGPGPNYLLYRPYHLCHLETPKAILAAAAGEPILTTSQKRCEVYAYAKRDLPAGTEIAHAIGSAECYGRVEALDSNKVPIALLETATRLRVSVKKGQALTFDELTLPECSLTTLAKKQQVILDNRQKL